MRRDPTPVRPKPQAVALSTAKMRRSAARARPVPALLFRGWFVVAGAFLVLMVGYGAAYSFAAFAEELGATFGATRSSVSVVYAICGFSAFTTCAVTGPLADRIGPRPLAVAGMLLVALGLVMAAAARTLMEVYLCYGLVIGLGVGFSYVPAVAAVQRWFVAWRGLASGIAAAGVGFGTALVPPAAQALTLVGDWRLAFMISGAGAAVVGVAGALLLASAPECLGLHPDGERPASPLQQGAPRLEGSEVTVVIRHHDFWLLYAGTLLVSIPISLPFAHLVHSAQQAGLTHAEALSLLSMLGIGSIAGRFLLGALADEIGRGTTFLASCAGVASMTLLWAWADGGTSLTVFAIGFGAAHGGFVALLAPFATDRFGRRAAAGVIGVLYTGRGVALLAAAPAAALVADNVGGYGAPLMLAAGLGAVGTALVAITKRRAIVAAAAGAD